MLTTRAPDLRHPDYQVKAPNARREKPWLPHKHIFLQLDGLQPDDAVNYFQSLLKLPPTPRLDLPFREDLLALFEIVQRLPLAISLLSVQLKNRQVLDVRKEIEELMVQSPDNPLLASLNLSVSRLDPEVKKWLPRLGVFQGGAMEDILLQVTGLGQIDDDSEVAQARKLLIAMRNEDTNAIFRLVMQVQGQNIPDEIELPPLPEELVQQLLQMAREQSSGLEAMLANKPQTELAEGMDEETWRKLRIELEATGLIRAEALENGRIFLKFHPTLASAMWSRLTEPEQQQLLSRHHQSYYQLSLYLHFEDNKNPFLARGIAQRELPNLLYALRGSIAAGEDFAADFVDIVNNFLEYFGLNQDRKDLTERAQHINAEVGSQTWYITRSNYGNQLKKAGHYTEAEVVFQEILAVLGANPSFERCSMLLQLGRCYRSLGQIERAVTIYRLALEEVQC